MRGEILEGLRTVRQHPVLLPIAMRSVVAHVAGSFYGVLYVIYLIEDLHLPPVVLGIVVSAGGVGSLVGSLFAARVIRALGLGPALIWTAVGGSVIGILEPLAQGPILLATAMVLIPQLFGDGLQTIEGVAELSLVQGLSPDRVLGRVNATLEVFSHGVAYPIGALIGSLFASRAIARLGIGPALIWAAAGASLVGILTPLAGGPVALAALMVFIPQLVGDGLQTIEGVAELSLIQGVIPDRILGRVNATLEVFSHGIAYPLGALLAAGVAELIGVRGGIFIGWAGMAVSILLLVFSPLPGVRKISDVAALEG
jgi:hypothetical protein